jgi:hypothetical protein
MSRSTDAIDDLLRQRLLAAPQPTISQVYELLNLLRRRRARADAFIEIACSEGIDWPLKLLISRRNKIETLHALASNAFLIDRATITIPGALDLLYSAAGYTTSDPTQQVVTWILTQRDHITACSEHVGTDGKPVVIPIDAQLASCIVKCQQSYIHSPPPLPPTWLNAGAIDVFIEDDKWRYDLDISSLSNKQFARLLKLAGPTALLNTPRRPYNQQLLRDRVLSLLQAIPEGASIVGNEYAHGALRSCEDGSDVILEKLSKRCSGDVLRRYVTGHWEVAETTLWPPASYLQALSTARGPSRITAQSLCKNAIANGAPLNYLCDLATYIPGAAVDAIDEPFTPTAHGPQGRFTAEDNHQAALANDLLRYIAAKLEEIPVETLYALTQLRAHPEVSLHTISSTLSRLHLVAPVA